MLKLWEVYSCKGYNTSWQAKWIKPIPIQSNPTQPKDFLETLPEKSVTSEDAAVAEVAVPVVAVEVVVLII